MANRLRRTLWTVLSVVSLAFVSGCRCSVSVNGNGQVPAAGGAGSLAVSAARECTWSAAAEGQWLSIKSGSNGQGDGSVEFSAVANPDPAVRRGAIVLNEQRVEVMQA